MRGGRVWEIWTKSKANAVFFLRKASLSSTTEMSQILSPSSEPNHHHCIQHHQGDGSPLAGQDGVAWGSSWHRHVRHGSDFSIVFDIPT